MKRRIQLLVALAVAVAIVATVAPAAFAQCGTAREFAMRANGATFGRIGVDTQADIPVINDGLSQVGIIWEAGAAAANNSGGPHMGNATTCDSTAWWLTGGSGAGQPPNARSIQGYLSSPACTLPVCPGSGRSLSVLVEDITADGSDAAYYMITADETPGPIRYYDLARADPATQPSNDVTHTMWRLPAVSVQSSSGPPPGTTLSNAYANVDVQVWGVGANGAPTQQVTSYDIFAVHAASPPGRQRSAWGAPLKTVAYLNNPPGSPVADSVAVPCPTATDNTYIAVGLTFDGGIPSFYVGKETEVECDPSIADPDVPGELRRRTRPNLPRGAAGR